MKTMLLAATLIAAPAFAQNAPPATPACVRAETMPGFEAWGHGGSGGVLRLDSMATLELAPAARAKFDPAPARPLAAGSFANQFSLTIPREGTYSIALSGKAWIEVARDGGRRVSIAHREGTACSGIRKIVDFALEAGTYQVQLSEAATPSLAVLVVRTP